MVVCFFIVILWLFKIVYYYLYMFNNLELIDYGELFGINY